MHPLHANWEKIGQRKNLNKLEVRWHDGVFLGLRESTNEYLIGTATGVVKAFSVKRKPESEQFVLEDLLSVKGVPWQPVPSIPTSMDVPTTTIVEAQPVDPAIGIPGHSAPEEPTVRQFYVRKEHILQYGYTVPCPGCDAIRSGARAVAHSIPCRERIQSELSKTQTGKRKVDLHHDKMAQAVIRHEEKRLKMEEERKRKREDTES